MTEAIRRYAQAQELHQVQRVSADALRIASAGDHAMSPAYAARNAYRSAEIETISQRDLIVKLYQGVERFLIQAKTGYDNGSLPTAVLGTTKAKAIFVELLSTLNFDVGGEVAEQLRDLYLFFVNEITQAMLDRRSERLVGILPIISGLREAWQQVPEEFANTSSLPSGHGGHSLSLRT